MSDEKIKQKLQEKYMELQMVSMHMRQYQQQADAIEQQCNELDAVHKALDDLNRSQPDEGFVTVTPGVMVKAKVEKTDRVVVNVGSGVFVEKSTAATRDDIAAQSAELRHVQQELALQFEKLAEKAQKVEKELQLLVK